MRKIINPCGFHCIKVNHLGVKFNEQVVLDDVNLHIHCGSLNAIIGKKRCGKINLDPGSVRQYPTYRRY